MEDSSLRSMKGPSLSSWGTTPVDHRDGEEEEEEETQESGWTAYLEDFSEHRRLLSNVDHHSSFCSSFSIGPSLISDAGSRYCDRANSVHGSPPDDSFDRLAVPKKLSLIKKMRAKKIAEEDPLEDTASSPASSPKVDDCEGKDINSGKAVNAEPNFFGNGGSCSYSHHGLEMEAIDGRKELDFKGQNGDSSRSLKSRGLCLVPLSLFANSVG